MIKGKEKTQGSEENIRRNREKAYPSSTCRLCAASAVKEVGGINCIDDYGAASTLAKEKVVDGPQQHRRQ